MLPWKVSEEVDIVLELCREITALCDPECIILFGQKQQVSDGELRDISLCVLVTTTQKEELEQSIYLQADCEISYNLLLYTPEEWQSLMKDPQSYASRIVQKGTTVYERPSK